MGVQLPPDGTRGRRHKTYLRDSGKAPHSLLPMLCAPLGTNATRQVKENAAGSDVKQEDRRMKCNRSARKGARRGVNCASSHLIWRPCR
ncbi:hypothetical protein E2C01_055973 [Portunus trituberculatus]|uniref:Uncharacterized protein n=1 Tax=Portunus trituberculatus TaxID=210409 RepID=A0A5B7GW53_PORTR|nr:hypothetical protein [Portunus trituberculatus]